MKIKKLTQRENGWYHFNLNVGGFTIRNCRWHPPTRRILFPIRYNHTRVTRRYPVVHAYGAQVKRLRGLLEAGQNEAPRDRRPCKFKARIAGISIERSIKYGDALSWIIFDFTVRGFTILGSRWQLETGSIQLPATYAYTNPDYRSGKVKKPVVVSQGPHINRLRAALEENLMEDALDLIRRRGIRRRDIERLRNAELAEAVP